MNDHRLTSLLVGLLLSGCYVAPAGPPPQAGPPPGAFGPPVGGPPGPIEAGCSFNGTNLQGEPGAVFQVSCPPGCESQGGLWGTDVYTADSGICRAGLHAGAISPAGGVVTVRIEPGRQAYRGSPRYGIQSSDYGQYPRSYTVFPAGPPPAPGYPPQAAYPPQPGYPPAPPPGYQAAPPAAYAQPAPGPPVIEVGCSYNSTEIRDAVGSSHLVNCPPGCGNGGGLWGTDVYTGDSGICRAAIHAGLINEAAGGTVRVTLDPGRPAYRGSFRNGQRSSDYGNYPKSFRVSPP